MKNTKTLNNLLSKKILTIAALAGVASLSYGQGYVDWFNTSGTRTSINTEIYGTSGGTASLTAASTGGSPLYYYALFVAPSTVTTIGVAPNGDPTTAGWTYTGYYATNVTLAGRLLAVSSEADGYGLSIPGYGVGSTASFAIVGWSASLGTTWAAVEPIVDAGTSQTNGYYGVDQSVATQIVLASYPGPYQDVMGSSPSAGGFAMYAVPTPEPATFAICGLGAAALVIFRRRK